MCDPITIGIAIGAGSAAIQGGGLKEIAMGAAFGAAGGALGAGAVGNFGNVFSQVPGQFLTGIASASVTGALTGVTVGSLLTGSGMFGTPETPGYTPVSQQVGQQQLQQQFNSQQIATTGSGGRQASASLAEAISRSKKRKLSQADVSDLSIDTSSFASTGLQFA